MKRYIKINIAVCSILSLSLLSAYKFTSTSTENNALFPGDSVKISKPKAPSWIPNAVFYEIYPQSFFDTNKDGIGDLPGITQKLDYVKSLGVNAIWLNPFYESPFRDAGYDITDYYKVAPRYGTQADIKFLFDQAKKKGIHVIVDFVPGHTSIDHPWFKASMDPKPNKYSNWYIWTDSPWDNGGEKYKDKMIHGYSGRNGNFMVNFFWHQPALNYGFGKVEAPWQLPVDHPAVLEVREEMKKIMRYWLDMGAEGFRIDMANSIVRNDVNGEGSKFWRDVRAMLDKDYPEAFIVSEWSGPKEAIAAGFHADFFHWFKEYEDLFRKEEWRTLNGVNEDGFSFFDKEGKGNITEFLDKYLIQLNATKDKGYISLPVGNHDLARINIKHTDQELEIIYAFLFTMPGVPFFYYGDEIGMRHLHNMPPKEGHYRPRAGARTPMQWTSGTNLGFSQGSEDKLYLPVDKTADAPNVEAQEKNPASLIHKIRKLIAMRRTEKALTAEGAFVPLYAEKNKYPFVYMRSANNEKIIVALNPSAEDRTVELPVVMNKKTILLSGNNVSFISKGKTTTLNMKGISYAIYKLKE